MPVPTDTFWNIRKLNVVFALSALLLLGATLALVMEDWNRPWRAYQQDAVKWDTAMDKDAIANALTAQQQQELVQLQQDISQAKANLAHNETRIDLETKLAAAKASEAALELPTAAAKGQVGPKEQQVERARLAYGDDSPQARGLALQLTAIRNKYQALADQLAGYTAQVTQYATALDEEAARMSAEQKRLDNLERDRKSKEEALAKINPSGIAKVGALIRNAPLLDWFNPSEKPQQVVVPDVRTNLNFLTVETIDRCTSCHTNIENPRYEEANLLMFAERQVATSEGQNLDTINHPVVLLEFWERAARARAATPEGRALVPQLKDAQDAALTAINALRSQIKLDPITSAQLPEEFATIALITDSSRPGVTRKQWYDPLAYYLADLKKMLRDNLGETQFGQLRDLYRYALIDAYNGYRHHSDLPALDANPVLLAHPKLELYVSAESKHPIKAMGCTVCHEGSGQETDFVHSAHTPEEVWVDSRTGAPVPDFLVRATGEANSLLDNLDKAAKPGAEAAASAMSPQVALASNTIESNISFQVPGAGHEHGVISQYDVNLANPGNPAPFAPDTGSPDPAALYYDPVDPADAHPQLALRQEQYWTRTYGWQHIHYDIWQTPMHSMEYIESSCDKCHSEVYDIRDQAPKLFAGRKLFAQLGCINCHAVEQLNKSAMDIKKVGPSLVHVHDKLSPEMMASWIWSPRAFRPMTRMPHFFMLENNSSPVDILRTRTEVAAITYYLQNTPPSPGTPTYVPETPPSTPGDPANGRTIFKTVGCLACHTNMAEFGQQWIVDDLTKREGLSDDEAHKRYDSMTYNQRHWYAMENLQDKLILIGPELSGVGTKLKTGRTLDQARTWVYDWVRNPRHYSSYTIMPRLRLSEQEANDLAAYLLTLERPDYKAESFDLDAQGKAMLDKLVVALPDPTGKVTVNSTFEEKLHHVGMKAIGNYGCSGCHLINGFENAVSACTQLDDWGLKDPHKLDFGYFDHTFDKDRDKPITVWKVAHEGLEPDAPQIKAKSDEDHSPDIHQVAIQWEDMELERRPWAYNKLHNTRIYDRGRTIFDGHLQDSPGNPSDGIDLGRPYDKLKMPKFFLTDEQVRELVTFVTSVRQPMVSDRLLALTYSPERLRQAHGRQLATMYNCYGCHNIDGNDPHIQLFFDVHNSDGSWNFANLQNAPPRLIGEGSRTQPDWLFDFLQDVRPLRPWLTIRMPSFPLQDSPEHAKGLVEFFAGNSQVFHDQLATALAPIDDYIKNNPGQDWFDKSDEVLGPAVQAVQDWAITLQLAAPSDFDPRSNTPDNLRTKFQGTGAPGDPPGIYGQLKFLCDLNKIEFPFPTPPITDISDEDFARGQQLFINEAKCVLCHALGDENKLLAIWKLDHPNAGKAPAKPAAPEEDYGDDTSTAKPAPKKDAGGGGDDYGDDTSSQAAAPPPVTGPVYKAPNLSMAARRLQWNWVFNWLQQPGTIMPGTSMPQFFPYGHTFDELYPPAKRRELDALYGYTGKEQELTLLKFIYAAGARNYTPGEERLQGGKPAVVQIKPLAPPPEESSPNPSAASPANAASAGSTPPPANTTSSSVPSPAAETPAAPAPPKPVPAVSSIELNDGAKAYQGTRIVGVVHFDGRPPHRRPIRMDADSYCMSAHPDAMPVSDEFVVNPDKTMQNVFVYVKDGLPPGQGFAIPDDLQHPQIAQQGCMYEPHVLGMISGQHLKIVNDDNTLHNVQAMPRFNPVFNDPMPVQGMVLDKAFNKPELTVMFKCQVHPWMTAYVHVLPHPFFAVSDVQGRFEIKGLPPGTYTLEALQEDGKRITPVDFQVTLAANTSQRSNVTLKPPGK